VSDGYWIMLKPLPVGAHTVHFHANLGATLDITYHITVVNQPKSRLRAFVYHDKTTFGRFNGGDKALQGWDVTLYDANGVVVDSQRTNFQGKVSFPLLTPGTYTICEELLPGWTNTQPTSLDPTYQQPCYTQTLEAGRTVDVRFGNHLGAVAAGEIEATSGVTSTDLVEAASIDDTEAAAPADPWLTSAETPEESETQARKVYLPAIDR
jgi:hypothetical protein